jgi:hypothetical protein
MSALCPGSAPPVYSVVIIFKIATVCESELATKWEGGKGKSVNGKGRGQSEGQNVPDIKGSGINVFPAVSQVLLYPLILTL